MRERKHLTIIFLVMLVTGLCNAALVAHWTFDEGQGNIAYDSVGSNHGTIYSALWAQGKIGGGLQFNGVNSWVDIGSDVMDFNGSNSFSVTLWVKGPGKNGQNAIVGTGVTDGWYIRIGSSKTGALPPDTTSYFFKIDDGNNNAFPVDVETINIADDNWHHLVASIDGSYLKGYVDGQLQFSVPYAGVGNLYNYFGIGHFAGGDYYIGLMDDVRLYDHALSLSEIQALIPEPATLLLMGLGCGYVFTTKRKNTV